MPDPRPPTRWAPRPIGVVSPSDEDEWWRTALDFTRSLVVHSILPRGATGASFAELRSCGDQLGAVVTHAQWWRCQHREPDPVAAAALDELLVAYGVLASALAAAADHPRTVSLFEVDAAVDELATEASAFIGRYDLPTADPDRPGDSGGTGD